MEAKTDIPTSTLLKRTRRNPGCRGSRLLRLLLISLLVIFIALLVVPFLIPIPPLEDILPVEQLAGPESRFAEVGGLQIHYREAGEGEPVFLLLHGFAASLFSWREVIPPLAERGRVIAYDRPGFGLTERPVEWEGQNPYSPEAQVELVIGMLDRLGVEQAILVGNSAGGSLAAQVALSHPERVQSLILVDAAVYAGGGAPAWVKPLLRTPQARRLGPLLVRSIRNWGLDFGRSAWHNPGLISEEIWEGYTLPLRAENWDRGLWELTLASRSPGLEDRLDELDMLVLVVTGDDDRIVPTEQSLRLAQEISGAELAVIPNCGHVPHEECPQAFMEAVTQFLDTHQLISIEH